MYRSGAGEGAQATPEDSSETAGSTHVCFSQGIFNFSPTSAARHARGSAGKPRRLQDTKYHFGILAEKILSIKPRPKIAIDM
jgi:hypothetical protein